MLYENKHRYAPWARDPHYLYRQSDYWLATLCCVFRLYLNGIHKVILASENDYLIYFYSTIIDARNEVKLERFNLVSCTRIIFGWRRMSREISMNQYHIDCSKICSCFWVIFSPDE